MPTIFCKASIYLMNSYNDIDLSFTLILKVFDITNLLYFSTVYTLFALCEYIIILSNVKFHTAFIEEIEDFRLVICDNEEFKTD